LTSVTGGRAWAATPTLENSAKNVTIESVKFLCMPITPGNRFL
jgi:hypothetical protein